MSYMSKLEDELRMKLLRGDGADDIVKWVSEKILASFKNGLKAKPREQKPLADQQSTERV